MKRMILLLICSALSLACAAETRTVRAPLTAAGERKSAPAFILSTAAGKIVRTTNYRGKVVLLDFRATECGGCRLEIPGFIGLHTRYRGRGLTAVGISMDIMYEGLRNAAEGWEKVTPFVKTEGIDYPSLMGDAAVSKAYDIQAMPATYLLDRKGRIAATYIGIVDQTDIEKNLKILIAE